MKSSNNSSAVLETPKVEVTKTKQQLAAEAKVAKEEQKLQQRIVKNRQKIRAFLKKQNTVYAICFVNDYGDLEFHKYNTLKDAEVGLVDFNFGHGIQENSAVIAEFTLHNVVLPNTAKKGQKKYYPEFSL